MSPDPLFVMGSRVAVRDDPVDVLANVGGFEIDVLAGLYLFLTGNLFLVKSQLPWQL